MSKNYLSEPNRFTRDPKLTAEKQYQRNLDDFHRWIKHDVSAFEHKCLTAELVIKKIQDTLELYQKEQDELIEEMLKETKKD